MSEDNPCRSPTDEDREHACCIAKQWLCDSQLSTRLWQHVTHFPDERFICPAAMLEGMAVALPAFPTPLLNDAELDTIDAEALEIAEAAVAAAVAAKAKPKAKAAKGKAKAAKAKATPKVKSRSGEGEGWQRRTRQRESCRR